MNNFFSNLARANLLQLSGFAPHRNAQETPHQWGFLEIFVIAQMALPALLYLPGTQPARVPIRMAAFGISLAALLYYQPARLEQRFCQHPSNRWLLASLAYLGLMVFHPYTNTLLAGIGQTILYLAVMAPVFWAPKILRKPDQLWRLLAITLICSGINSIVGVLQVYDPQTWLPREYSSVIAQSAFGPLMYQRADGTTVVRPPGLSDNPGAVCGPGMISAVLGLIFAANCSTLWKRAASLILSFAGIAAVLLSQVRTSFAILAGTVLTYVILLAIHRKSFQTGFIIVCSTGVFAIAWAFSGWLGGPDVVDRVSSLWEDDPAAVYYYAGRGGQLQDAFQFQLKQYPLGAGLGRWGMMRVYFGDESNRQSPPIWAELQLPAWLFDGGIILICSYGIALLLNARRELYLSQSAKYQETRSLAAIIFALNAGTLALCFGFTPFTTQIGLQYWFFAGAIHGLGRQEEK
jgi:hypothetical protein